MAFLQNKKIEQFVLKEKSKNLAHISKAFAILPWEDQVKWVNECLHSIDLEEEAAFQSQADLFNNHFLRKYGKIFG